MQFIPADAYQYLHMMSGMGIPLPSGSQEMAEYSEWVATQHNSSASAAPAPAGTQTSFYLILSFPQGDFADKIDDDANYPMWVPASGTTPKILGVFGDEKQANIKMEEDNESVHVMYQCKIGGRDKITEFLEFMAENDMLTPTSGK